jgi:hypothetical protein
MLDHLRGKLDTCAEDAFRASRNSGRGLTIDAACEVFYRAATSTGGFSPAVKVVHGPAFMSCRIGFSHAN